MARTVYALLAAINDYGGRLKTLEGCVDDVRGFQEFLEARVEEGRRAVLPLINSDATRQNIINGFTNHLTKAGKDDVAIFYFSGHGSHEPVEERYWQLEPSGRNQTIVCADSRSGKIPDLADKELNELIGAVVANGPHVLVVLDCCHSGGGTRDPVGLPVDVRARLAPPAEVPRAPETYLPGVRDAMAAAGREAGPPTAAAARDQAPRHVALSACEAKQLAIELPIGGTVRGVFSAMLQRALTTMGPATTYRDLLGAATVGVRDRVFDQHPVGYVAEPTDLDQPLFGGAIAPRRSGITLEHYRDTWWIDAGAIHGIQPRQGDQTTVLAIPAPPDAATPERAIGHVRVAEVELARSRVTVDDDWQPDPERRYAAVPIDVPLPPASVDLRGDAAAIELVRARLRGSPHVRESTGDPGTGGDRFLVLAGAGTLTVARADAWPLAAPAAADADGARSTVERLEHLSRWHLIKRLDNPLSAIAGTVRLALVPAERAERAPRWGEREPLVPGRDGTIHLKYRQAGSGWQHPYAFVYLLNDSDSDLYCTLLDLTDSYRCHSRLFPADRVARRSAAVAYEGKAIDFTIPKARLEAGGRFVDDWLKLLAAEERFAPDAFDLPNLDAGTAPRSAALRGRVRSTIDRIANAAITRDAGDEPVGAPEWTTMLVTVRTGLDEPPA